MLMHSQGWEPLVSNSLSSGSVVSQTGCTWISHAVYSTRALQPQPEPLPVKPGWLLAPACFAVVTQEPEAHRACLETDTHALFPMCFVFKRLYISSTYCWYLLLSRKYVDLQCHFLYTGHVYKEICHYIFAYLYFMHSWRTPIDRKIWWMKICKCFYLKNATVHFYVFKL